MGKANSRTFDTSRLRVLKGKHPEKKVTKISITNQCTLQKSENREDRSEIGVSGGKIGSKKKENQSQHSTRRT